MTKFAPLEDWLWPAVCMRVVDGDTLDVRVDRGFRDQSEMRIRLYGVNTPERGQPGYGQAASALHDLLFGGVLIDIPRPLICRTIMEQEKYGRWLATVQVVDGVDNVSMELIRRGLGVEYYGGTR